MWVGTRIGRSRIRIQLSEGIELLSKPKEEFDSLRSGSMIEFTFQIVVSEIERAQLAVYFATTEDAPYFIGNYAILYFAVNGGKLSASKTPIIQRSAKSRRAEPTSGQVLPPAEWPSTGAPPGPATDRSRLKPISLSWHEDSQPEQQRSPRGSVQFTGGFVYQDTLGVDRPARWSTAWFYDKDNISGDDYLGSALVDANGHFVSDWFDNSDGLGEGGTLDPYIVFVASNGAVSVYDPSDNYYDGWTSQPIFWDVADGTIDLGNWRAPTSENEAWWIFQWINDGWNFYRNQGPNYSMPEIGVKYPFESWAHYHLGGQIHIPDANTARSPDVLVHEYAHFAMYTLYGNWFPQSNCPSPHYINSCSHVNCAWTEGWASFVPIAVYNSPVIHHVGSYLVNFENYSGIGYWEDGDCVEGRVTGALNDLYDSPDDGWDHYAGGFMPIHNVFSSQTDNNFNEFWNAWVAAGQPDCAPVSSIRQNTIDYNSTPTISGIPDRTVVAGTTNDNAIDLWSYAADNECSDSELSFRLIGSNSCGVTIDGRYVDINPGPSGTTYSCTITVEVSDGSETGTDAFVVTVQPNNTVTVTSPNGGENWYVGSSHDITWTWTGSFNNAKIELSRDGGTSWSTLIASTPNDGIWTWSPVSGPASPTCKVKISDAANAATVDLSNTNFTISEEIIAVTSPNGGENWCVGSTHDITWTSSGIANVKIEYTTNGGSSWTTIIASTPSDGSYSWVVSNAPSANCKVRICDAADGAPCDESNSSFTISAQTILVVSPNGGESWCVGSTHDITWTSSCIDNVKIEYTTNGGSSWTTIIASTPSDGSYSWVLPNAPSANCKVRICDAVDGTPCDESNSSFTISPQTVVVVIPNGGESWVVGSSHDITWTSTCSIANVKIELSRDGGTIWSTLVASTPNDGIWTWASVSGPASTTCKVRISDATNAATVDQSNANFTISDVTITVTSPNGGENWCVVSSHDITWTSTGPIANVKIELSRDGGTGWSTLIASTPNDGSWTWSPITGPVSTTCRVRISDAVNAATFDLSNANFTISDVSITVTSPNGGENWFVPSLHDITWNWTCSFANVKIELSRDGGSTWELLIASTPNDGVWNWTVTGPSSGTCKVRISDAANAATVDLSNANFTISGDDSIIVTSPNGGENWAVGSSHDITWICTGSFSNVKIELSRDGGSHWGDLLIASTPNDSVWNWIVTGPASTTCKVRISNTANLATQDGSNANFTISEEIVSVTSPNGGENWCVGSSHDITWTSTGSIASVKIELSRDGGTGWSTLIASTPNGGSWTWSSVLGPASPTCKVRISDAVDGVPADTSDGNFNIGIDCGWRCTIHAEGQVVGSAVHQSDVIVGVETMEDTYPAPPVPVEYTVYTRLWRQGWVGPFFRDVRADDGSTCDSWIIEIDPHGNVPPPGSRCAIVSWNSACFSPEGSYSLWEDVDSDGDADVVVVPDMRSTLQYQVCGTGTRYYVIKWCLEVCVTFDLCTGWNLISLPVIPASDLVSTLFPSALAAFKFEGSYAPITQLEPCKGYWLKVPAAVSVQVCGQPVMDCTSQRIAGWHLIGGPNCRVMPTTTPPSNLLALFGFNCSSYVPETQVDSTRGYWAKLAATCLLNLSCGSSSVFGKQAMGTEAQSDQFTLRAMGEDLGGVSQSEVVIGFSGEAQSLPAPPNPPNYSVKLETFRSDWAGPYYQDLRLEGSSDNAWIIAVNPHGNIQPPTARTAILSWDPAEFSGEIYRLREGYDGSGQVVIEDMRLESQLAVTGADGDKYYTIEYLGTALATAVDHAALPGVYVLQQCYPNPFNPLTTIVYDLPRASRVSLSITDLLGREVRKLVDGYEPAGRREALWDGRDKNGQEVASGVYFYRLTAGDFTDTKKMLLLK